MWIPTAMIAAAAGAGLMAAVMAYLAAVERDNLVWRLWSISFALDAARTLVLAFASPHGTVTDATQRADAALIRRASAWQPQRRQLAVARSQTRDARGASCACRQCPVLPASGSKMAAHPSAPSA